MDMKSNEPSSGTTFMGVNREKIPWWPSVDLDRCDGCNGEYDCIKFCPHKVYRPLENPTKVDVENQYNCVVFCQACKKMCPKDAISFPLKSDILKLIKTERAK